MMLVRCTFCLPADPTDPFTAFGGTLSSYTWICLIIAFLQLRSPPVLPALHQLSHKLPRPDGTMPDFADDLKKLSGYGNKNKSSVAELLFQFFRFYAHEFDYDKHVLSVRLGKLVTKHEKKWHYAINNQLCVEEPFNTSRNLGNTADEYSFRGLHMELRRAFDLISVANLEEACEPYVFPKEEEKVWSRPPPQSRPVLLRSSSQTHSGRGGRGNHRGGRHNNNFHRNTNSSRRASSGVPQYDANNNNMYIPQVSMPQDLQWYQNPQFQFQYTQQDLMTQMAYHQENMRLLYASQSPAFMQHQAQAQAQAMNQQQQQRMSTSAGSNQQQQQQSTDRSRTNSFDNPPLSAPLRPDLYALYGMTLGGPFFPQAGGYGTYPSSPASTNGATQDFRRSMQRSGANNEAGGSGSNGTLRSHSQPASRSPSGQAAGNCFGNQQVNGAANSRSMNGVPIPSFMSDDTDFDETPKAHTDSPQSEEGKYATFYLTESPSPGKQSQKSQGGSNGIAFGDLSSQNSSPGRRRLSTDQLPQTILDRRMRRTSRSPSPLGHSRAFSASTASAPLAQGPFPGSQNKNLSRPLVVNGSCLKTSVIQSPRQPSGSESNASEDSSNFENPLQINVGNGMPSYPVDGPIVSSSASEEATAKRVVSNQVPIVANGTTHLAPSTADDPSFRDRILMMNSHYMASSHLVQEPVAGTSRLSPSTRQRLMSRQQNGIAPLDLAIAEHRIDRPVGQDFAHLSPVYENRTPSPTVVRKPDGSLKSDKQAAQNNPKASRGEGPKAGQKPDERVQDSQDGSKPQKGQKAAAQSHKVNGARENGHGRGAKSESDGGWQKAGKGKKKGANNAANQGNGEQLPKLESERKGG